MLTVLVGVTTFLLVVLLMIGLLLGARSQLVSTGVVNIVVNDDPDSTLSTVSGGTLLGTLADNEIFIPSACGGKGSCGVCKVKVTEGGGALLPTEVGHVNRGEAREGVRLSCQVKIKGDMKIALPEEIFGIQRWTCRVRSNDNVATFIKELVLELPEGQAVPFRAGGYIQIECPPHTVKYEDFDIAPRYRDDWDRFKLWSLVSEVKEPVTRAYSMANYPDERGLIMLNVRAATPPPRTSGLPPGVMSSYIFSLKPGDEVTISGPLRRVLRQEHRERDVLHRGWGGDGAHALPHLRPVQAAEDGPEGLFLVWSPVSARSLLRRPLRRHCGRAPELRVAPRPFGAASRRRVDGLERLHSSGAVRRVPEPAPSAGGGRILPLRPADDAEGLHGHVGGPWRPS